LKFWRTIIIALSLLVFAFSPVAIAFLLWAGSGFAGSMWSEGPGGHGAVLWLLLVTLPLGGLGFIILVLSCLVSRPERGAAERSEE
jgi:TRAP-type C4-dicarboxylate transport system permease small subunit